ncbi:MAG TPA: hypothetical protein PK413_20020, partial [Thermoanaerobaculia bacterium]|nr:hypothetical protein [Thermoanaerobaculia bacterium]
MPTSRLLGIAGLASLLGLPLLGGASVERRLHVEVKLHEAASTRSTDGSSSATLQLWGPPDTRLASSPLTEVALAVPGLAELILPGSLPESAFFQVRLVSDRYWSPGALARPGEGTIRLDAWP